MCNLAKSFSAKKRSKSDKEVPCNMQYEMLAECSLSSLNLSTKVSMLSSTELRLCHEEEWNIYKQIQSIKSEVIEKEGLFKSMFGRTRYSFFADYVQIVGDFPFRPHRMLGLTPCLSIRVSDETNWSDSLDILKADFDGKEVSINIRNASILNAKSQRNLQQYESSHYEFGIHLERGKDTLNNITSISIVPKHIVISKLSFPIEMRQISASEDFFPVVLYPESVQSFHFLTKGKYKKLQIRRHYGDQDDADGMNARGKNFDSSKIDLNWAGEIDISNLGFVFAKLKNPLLIIKVTVEIVGASWISTFTEQSPLWPPYRVDNRTNFDLKFKQIVDSPKGKDVDGEYNAADTIVAEYPSWEILERNKSCSYTWDLPFSGKKLLKIEIMQGTQCVSKDVSLDDGAKVEKILLRKSIPNLGNPLAEGYLSQYMAQSDTWNQVYCILRPDILYVYEDESRSNLKDVIFLSSLTEDGPIFAAVSKYEEKQWDFRSSLRIFGNATEVPSSRKKIHDSNRMRILMLQIADIAGLFSTSNFNFNENTVDTSDDVSVNESVHVRVEESIDENIIPWKLKELLKNKNGVEHLLDELPHKHIKVSQVVSALIVLRQADSIEKATDFCCSLLDGGFLKPVFEDSSDSTNFQKARNSIITDNKKPFFPDEMDSSIHNDDNDSDLNNNNTNNNNNNNTFFEDTPSASVPMNTDSSSLFEADGTLNLHALLFMNPPILFPEMLELDTLSQINNSYDIEDRKQTSIGFTISKFSRKYHFKCGSELEFLGWIQSCRLSIELSWIDHELGRKTEKDYFTVADLQVTVNIKVRADGPTKVLEMVEENNDSQFEKKNSSNAKSVTKMIKGVKNEVIKSLTKFHQNATSNSVNELNLADMYADADMLYVSFSVQSIAFSLMDAEPRELFYLSLHDTEMTIERSFDTVKFSVTVHEIQISNQLLKPEFPVALFPRKLKEVQGKLILPGLDPNRITYPSLHLFLQQKYHKDGNVLATAFEDETNLYYFDILMIWVSPIQLDVDEEFLIRCYRFINSIVSLQNKFDNHFHSVIKGKIDIESIEENTPLHILKSHILLSDLNKRPYLDYKRKKKHSRSIYFNLLQLHPIDIIISFCSSPDFECNNLETAFITIISQLDSARLCLNALMAENAFGSSSMMADILIKHYRASFWRQFHKFIGSADIVDGSVGLVANLGTGVYDLFYEPIDGLIDTNGTFLNGISKGAVSLSSRAIGGTSGVTSKIASGIGKGVSLLTFDSQFQKSRTYRKYNKTNTVSEGLYVGTKELGKNILEGVTGVVVAPYRGWETGGGLGFSVGIAKGILGVAIKPTVGLFDLASRATEGLRNAAMKDNENYEDRLGIHRYRIPRSFGRNKLLVNYNEEKSAAQYVADHLTQFKADPRIRVVAHLQINRNIKYTNASGKALDILESEFNSVPSDEEEHYVKEAWGMGINNSYIVLICEDRIVLAQIESNNYLNSLVTKFVWSCPADSIDQLFSDNRGDLVLSMNKPVHTSGAWNGLNPVIIDDLGKDYLIFQSLLEQTIGPRLARLQPICPTIGELQSGILKRYSSGIKSLLFTTPSKHTYRLYGNVLYEYSPKKNSIKFDNTSTRNQSAEGEGDVFRNDSIVRNSEEYINKKVLKFFYNIKQSSGINDSSASLFAENFLSFVYPLVDLIVTGPIQEDGGKQFSINIVRLDNNKMRTLKKDDESETLSEYLKISLSLIFSSYDDAFRWKQLISNHTITNPPNILPSSPLSAEEKKRNKLMNTIQIEESILGTLIIPASGCKPENVEGIKIEIAKTLSTVQGK